MLRLFWQRSKELTRFTVLLGLAGNLSAMPDIPKWEITPGIGMGYSTIQGAFDQFYKPGFDLNFSLFFPTGRWNSFVQPMASFGSFPFRTADSTKLTHYDFSVPLGIYWPAFAGISPFVAIGPEFSYYTLAAASTGLSSTAYRIKPMASAGLLIPVNYFSFITVGAKYSYTQLSGEAFGNITLTAGFTVSYPTYRRNDEAVSKALAEQSRAQAIAAEVEALFKAGRTFIAEEKYDEAEQKFREVLALKPGDAEARREIDRARTLPILKEARLYREEGKGLSAIRSYEKAAVSLEEARTELTEFRQELKSSVPALTKSAIDAYNTGQYINAIVMLERIQAIDPENETVKIYLPRARNRQRAIDKLN